MRVCPSRSVRNQRFVRASQEMSVAVYVVLVTILGLLWRSFGVEGNDTEYNQMPFVGV